MTTKSNPSYIITDEFYSSMRSFSDYLCNGVQSYFSQLPMNKRATLRGHFFSLMKPKDAQENEAFSRNLEIVKKTFEQEKSNQELLKQNSLLFYQKRDRYLAIQEQYLFEDWAQKKFKKIHFGNHFPLKDEFGEFKPRWLIVLLVENTLLQKKPHPFEFFCKLYENFLKIDDIEVFRELFFKPEVPSNDSKPNLKHTESVRILSSPQISEDYCWNLLIKVMFDTINKECVSSMKAVGLNVDLVSRGKTEADQAQMNASINRLDHIESLITVKFLQLVGLLKEFKEKWLSGKIKEPDMQSFVSINKELERLKSTISRTLKVEKVGSSIKTVDPTGNKPCATAPLRRSMIGFSDLAKTSTGGGKGDSETTEKMLLSHSNDNITFLPQSPGIDPSPNENQKKWSIKDLSDMHSNVNKIFITLSEADLLLHKFEIEYGDLLVEKQTVEKSMEALESLENSSKQKLKDTAQHRLSDIQSKLDVHEKLLEWRKCIKTAKKIAHTTLNKLKSFTSVDEPTVNQQRNRNSSGV